MLQHVLNVQQDLNALQLQLALLHVLVVQLSNIPQLVEHNVTHVQLVIHVPVHLLRLLLVQLVLTH